MKTWILSLCLIFSSIFSSIEAQSLGLLIPAGQDKIDIPFEYSNNFIIVKVNFNYVFQLRFIFDTGAEHTILSQKSIANILNMEYDRTFKVLGSDLQTELIAYLVRDVPIKISNAHAPHQDILVLDQDYFRFEEFTGTEIHGIIGADLFRRHAVKINYRKRVISIYNSNNSKSFKPSEKKKYQKLDIEIIKNKPYLSTQTHLVNGDTVQTKLLIDTGASLALLLNTFTHPQLKLPENAIKGNIGKGLGGFLEGYKGRVKGLDLGAYRIPSIVTNFQELNVLSDTTFLNGRNGIIGNEILNRFNMVIDYHNEKLYLKANKNFKKTFKHDRSGITMIATGTTLNDYMVHAISENAPAHEAGIQKGDIIKSINFIPVKLLSLKNAADLFHGKVGKQIRLVFKRKGERKIITFKLRNLI